MATSKKDWSIKRNLVKNKQSEVKQLSEVEKQQQKVAVQKAIKLFSEIQPGADNFGTLVAGFQSIAESVKPRGNKKDPTPSVMGATVGANTSTTSSPTQKADIDVLTEKQTKADNIVKKALADGSPKGIRAALGEVVNLYEDEINAGVAEVNKAADDPVVKEQFAKIGLDTSLIAQATSLIDGNPGKLVAQNQGSNIVVEQKKVATAQMKALGNPFGSFLSKINTGGIDGIKVGDPISPNSASVSKALQKTGLDFSSISTQNPFGNMGIDNANIMGSIASATKGLPNMTQLGVEVPAANDIEKQTALLSGIEIPSIVDLKGNTNLAGTVDLGSITAVEAPTTPVEEIGVSTNQPTKALLFTRVGGAQEIELEIRACKRSWFNINVGWTLSAADQKYTAKEFNDKRSKHKRAMFEEQGVDLTAFTELDYAANCHYYFNKDGTIERIKSLDLSGGNYGAIEYNSRDPNIINWNITLATGISLIIDAGDTANWAERSFKTLNSKSITDEQWKSLDMFFSAAFRARRAMTGISWDIEVGKILPSNLAVTYGPGFDVDKYMDKFAGRIKTR